MELHHIVEKANGGEDTFENCIPLCFDCHADVGHYNVKHPKGKKITPGELKGHRDHWYTRIAAVGAIQPDDRFQELDRSVVGKLRAMLPRYGRLATIRTFDYGGTFDDAWHEELKRFAYYFNGPDYEFLDADLEAQLADLRAAVTRFLRVVAVKTWPTKTGEGLRAIPDEWQYKDPSRWETAQELLNTSAEELCAKYDDLIRLARIKLGELAEEPIN